MARRRGRRRGSRRGRGRRNGSGNSFRITVPFLLQVSEGSEYSLSFEKLIGPAASVMWTGIPWRLVSIQFTATNTSFKADDSVSFEPSILQTNLDSGQTANIEGMASARTMVTHVQRRVSLRMPQPNPWKEDEERKQDIINFQHFKYGQSQIKNSVVYILGTSVVEFGRIPITFSSSMHVALPEHCKRLPPASSQPSSPFSDLEVLEHY